METESGLKLSFDVLHCSLKSTPPLLFEKSHPLTYFVNWSSHVDVSLTHQCLLSRDVSLLSTSAPPPSTEMDCYNEHVSLLFVMATAAHADAVASNSFKHFVFNPFLSLFTETHITYEKNTHIGIHCPRHVLTVQPHWRRKKIKDCSHASPDWT